MTPVQTTDVLPTKVTGHAVPHTVHDAFDTRLVPVMVIAVGVFRVTEVGATDDAVGTGCTATHEHNGISINQNTNTKNTISTTSHSSSRCPLSAIVAHSDGAVTH